jgi:hypothetical protein
VTACIVISLLVLLAGVVVLSSKKPEPTSKADAPTFDAEGQTDAVDQPDSFAMSMLDKAKSKIHDLKSPRSAGTQLLSKSRDGPAPPSDSARRTGTEDRSPFDDQYEIGNASTTSLDDFQPFVSANDKDEGSAGR